MCTRLIAISLLLCSITVHAEDCVILLHGLARSSTSMEKLENALTKSGFRVVNQQYASREKTIQTIAKEDVPVALNACAMTDKIHFITHSLGGIIVRQYLSTSSIENLGRTVMLGPPNKGSEVVDTLKHLPGFAWINGPAGLQLGTDTQSIPSMLGKVDYEVGIIAGTRSINLILSTMLPNPDDGKVSVENTKLEGMADHLEIPVSHPFLMKDDTVIQQAIYFLQHGKFSRSLFDPA